MRATRLRHTAVRDSKRMKNTATLERPTGTENEAELSIPLDLSQWVPCSQLGEWIKEDVGALNWNNPELLAALRRQPEYEPRPLLQTLVLGYATGVFGAEEIERHCATNPDFRAVRPKFSPRPVELKQFRRENLGLLKWCLVKVITRALTSQFIERDEIEVLPPGLRRHVVENATERMDLARHMDRSAAL